FADLDVLLIGKVVADIDNSFASYWSAPISFDIQTLATLDKGETTDFLEGLDKLRVDEKNNSKSSLDVYKTAIEDSSIDSDLINKRVPFRWTDMQFLSDDVGRLTKTVPADTNLVHQLRTLLGSPTKRLTIISSYFVPTKDGVNTLVELAEAGIDIKILTNSFDATDVTTVHSGYSQWRPSLLRAGVKIYELNQPLLKKNAQTSFGRRAVNRLPACMPRLLPLTTTKYLLAHIMSIRAPPILIPRWASLSMTRSWQNNCIVRSAMNYWVKPMKLSC